MVVSRENGDRLANLGLCPGETIDHLLDSVRGLQAERLVGDVRDSKRHGDLPGRSRPRQPPSTDLRTESRLGTVAATTAASRPATAQLASSSQRSNHCDRLPTHSSTIIANKGRRRQRREPVRRHAGPLDELRERQQQKHQSVVEVVGCRERAQINERAHMQSDERGRWRPSSHRLAERGGGGLRTAIAAAMKPSGTRRAVA